MLHAIKNHLPIPLLQAYHFTLAKLSAALYGMPSNKMIVIGVTGTNGKSSTVQMIAQLLTTLGERVGYTTTAGFWIAGKEIENKMKMTMPGRLYLQQLLREMVREKCTYAIVETSSQGIEQFRHLGVNYDVAVFTNLTPEHIEAHGGFDNYKKAKGKLFSHLTRMPRKVFGQVKLPKRIVVNLDDEHAPYFASFPCDELIGFSLEGRANEEGVNAMMSDYGGVPIAEINGLLANVPFLAPFEQKNAFMALSTLFALQIPLAKLIPAFEALKPIPGRFERIDLGQDFVVIVDYAYEPYALRALFAAVQKLNPKRLIGVHGSAGGGRDIARRTQIGRLAAQTESVVIVTNEDPYDEDPRKIIEDVAQGAIDAGLVEGTNLFLIDDRMEAIEKAIFLAEPGDVVLLTGKGSEPVMAVANGKKIPWSDKDAAEMALRKRLL